MSSFLKAGHNSNLLSEFKHSTNDRKFSSEDYFVPVENIRNFSIIAVIRFAILCYLFTK